MLFRSDGLFLFIETKKERNVSMYMYHISATWPSTGHENDNLPTRLHQHPSQLKWKLARRQKWCDHSFLRRITNPPIFVFYNMIYVHVMKKPAPGRPLLISSSSLSNNGMHLKICQELYFSRLSTGRGRMYRMMN